LLSSSELKTLMEKLSIQLNAEELSCLLIEFDPTGQGRDLDVAEFENDFNKFIGKELGRQ
jgi:hypothetical protein